MEDEKPANTNRLRSFLINLLLTLCSIGLSFAALEFFLWAWGGTHAAQPPPRTVAVPAPASPDSDIPIPPEVRAIAEGRYKLLTLPDEWKHTPAPTPAGADDAQYWHGALHVRNSDRMRWAGPFPERRSDTYRVMVVGDSLTYGVGLAEQWRFSSLAEQSLGRQFRIEFLNLGIAGAQSEDVLFFVRKYLPILQPNLVIYAVCLNDFLPSGIGQYTTQAAYPFPLPDGIKTFLIQNTRSGAFLNESYDAALRRLHLRADFFDDILADFGGYQNRFARDVQDINKSVQAAGLPPLVGIVVDQFPAYDSAGYRIAMIAEAALRQAGAAVIPTEDYYRRYNGQSFYISRWEGHPNEIANIIWANMIAQVLSKRENLQAFRR
ncbi:MAG: SGNH/GDSL hydrolase family protein [Bradyrhizobium icense]|nr:MAG: SGNH/GDSL hydrolase family protein [Bradyrhizobium icense]